MASFSNTNITSVNLSNDSDHKDNNGSLESKRDETSVQEKTLHEIALNEDTNTWNYNQPQTPKVIALLRTMIVKNIKQNVAIYIGGSTFKCHMAVLQCYSQFFKKFTTEVEVRLPQDKVTARAFTMLYQWMLSDKPLVKPEGMVELFFAAKFLDIEELVRQCWSCFGDANCYREDIAFLIYMEATKAGHKDLEQLMLMRVSKFFLTVVASRDFLELTANEICNILSSNAIGVNSEIEVLFSAVRWLTHNWEERKEFRANVVKYVRFNLMPSWYLVTLRKEAVSSEVLKVIKHPDVDEMITDGISYVTLPQSFYSKSEVQFQQFLKDMNLTPSPQRTWIYDQYCEYHQSKLSQKMASAKYEVFKAYLGRIRIMGEAHWHQLKLAKDVNGSVSNSSI